MSDLVSRTRDIILDLEKAIEEKKRVLAEIRSLNPTWEEVSEKTWPQKEAMCWIHGATDPGEACGLEKWLFFRQKPTDIECDPAEEFIKEWRNHPDYYGVFLDFAGTYLPAPTKEQSLAGYVSSLAQEAEKNGWKSERYKQMVHSFLFFLREEYGQESSAFIDHIFPREMTLQHGRVLRLIDPTQYAIPVEAAGEVLRNLARRLTQGNPKGRQNAAEALALIWLCLTASRIRLPRTLKMIHGIHRKALCVSSAAPVLQIPSRFGEQEITISKRMGDFLSIVADFPNSRASESIIHKDLRSLRVHLDAAVSASNLPPEIGPISFLTFLTSPHHFGPRIRYRPKTYESPEQKKAKTLP